MTYTREQIEYKARLNAEHGFTQDAEMLRQLLAENDALRADAGRYAWMRETFIDDNTPWPDDVADAKSGAKLDRAIDAARKANHD